MNGQRVGSYEIVRMLARGGMAVVYLVRQPALDREVVLKRLDLERDDPTLAQRFVREARLAAALDHPNVVTLFDFFEHDGVPYIAMEYVAGGSLRSLVGTLDLPQVLGVLEGTLAGLGHAERHGIAHRDLKPENILITRRGNVKIADFGIARAYNALSQRLTITGKAMGTPVYMAPEQALDKPIGPPTDLYALGVIVYELLAGRPPFEADLPMGVLYRHVHEPPPPLPQSIHPAMREWVGWLLAKAPADRPQSAGEAWQALEEIAVAELGPYWRRAATITIPTGDQPRPPHDDTALTSTDETSERTADTQGLPEPTPVAPQPQRRSRRRFALAAGMLGAAGVAATLAVTLPDDPAARKPPPQPARAATPYDFDGDRRQELVMAMLRAAPQGSPVLSGVVLIRRGRGWRVITESDARVPGRPRSDDAFGSGLASGDFDRNGSADLAIGTPGRSRVSVLFGGGARGITGGRDLQFAGAAQDVPAEYGYLLLARDVNGDRHDDLIVGAPGRGPGRGAVQILFGGADGLRTSRSRIISPPAEAADGFGTRMRTGDIDGDRRVDLVEGAPADTAGGGHLSYCRGERSGPSRCSALEGARGTSALAVADVNRDGYADIVQGDSDHAQNVTGLKLSGGEVRLWLGSRRGPRRAPITISQDTPAVPGTDEPGDEFGAVVEAGDLDSDGFADMIIGATRENSGAGKVTVVRGHRRGYATTGNSSFDQDSPFVPGNAEPEGEFGSTLSVLHLSADRRLDLAVAARGRRSTVERVMVIEGGTGVFAPDETSTSTLGDPSARVRTTRGDRIRLAKLAGG